MAKAQAAVETQTESTSFEEILKRPDTIALFGHSYQVMDEFTIHARNGYKPFAGVAMQYFPGGMMSILLQLGDPLPLAHQRAKESIASEQRKEAAEFTRRVNEEAQRIATAKAKAELDARIAAAEAVANAAVEKIRRDAEAERARIEQAQ